MSWLIVLLRTLSLSERESSNQSETSYHKVAADEKTLVLMIHTGCALADVV